MNRPLFILTAICLMAAASMQLRRYKINYCATSLPRSKEFTFMKPCDLYMIADPDRIVIDTAAFLVYGTATYGDGRHVYQCTRKGRGVTITMQGDTAKAYHYIVTVAWRDSAVKYWAWPVEP